MSTQPKRLLIVGKGRHGKDTVAEYLRDKHGYNFISSSEYAARKFIFHRLKHKYGYNTVEECFNDRHRNDCEVNMRAVWYELICEYNKNNPSRLAEGVINDGYDIYVGMRDGKELLHCRDEKIFDYIIWVDAEERMGDTESSDSCTVEMWMADLVIYNNGTLEELHESVDQLVREYKLR